MQKWVARRVVPLRPGQLLTHTSHGEHIERFKLTAQNLCVTFASLASMASPLISAYLITLLGGIEVENIRPLYYLRALGFSAVFLFIVTQLQEPLRRQDGQRAPRTRFIDDFRSLFRQNDNLWKWIAISSLASFSLAVETPFRMLFAHQEKESPDQE